MAKKRRNSKENPVREWISDNLRYLLLVLIVIIAALAAFLIYREVTERRQVGSGTVVEPSSASSETDLTSTSVSAESSASTSTEVVTATPTHTATETPTPTPFPDVALTEMVPAAEEAVQNALYSMQANGENENVEYYDSIHVQTCPGPTEGTYIAYADYDYKYWDYDVMIPGLTEYYLAPDEEGNLQEVKNVPADVQAYITNVRQTDSVQALIQEVTNRYNTVMEANPDLSEFVAGLE